MIKNKSLRNFLILLAAVSGAVWFGSYITRFSAFYFLFEGPELAMKALFQTEMLRGFLYGLIPSLSISIFAYLAFLLCFYLWVFTSGLSLKNEGWLFISLVLITLTAPFELYLIWKYDYKLFAMLYYSQFNPENSVQFYIERIKTFSFMPIVSLLDLVTVFGLFYYRPFVKKQENE